MIIYLKYIRAIGIFVFTLNLLNYFISEVGLRLKFRIIFWIRIPHKKTCLNGVR